jgi:Na+/H+-dicarboxylate symporter
MSAPSQSRFVSRFGVQVLAGMLLGLALGLVARKLGTGDGQAGVALAEGLKITGQTFVQLLKALVPPLVFVAIVASVANLSKLENAEALVWRTLVGFAVTALIAVLIGIGLGLVLQPGLHSGVAATAAKAPGSAGGWLDFLNGLVPSNFLGLTASTKLVHGAPSTSVSFNVLQILVIALAAGAAALKAGEAGKSFLAFNASALAVLRKILTWVIRLTPIGTVGLIGSAAATYGWSALGQLGHFAVAVYAGLGLVLFVVYPGLLLANRQNPVAFFRTVWPAIQLGFVSPLVYRDPAGDRGRDRAPGRSQGLCRLRPCRWVRRPRWTVAPASIPPSRRSSWRSSTACRCTWRIMASSPSSR